MIAGGIWPMPPISAFAVVGAVVRGGSDQAPTRKRGAVAWRSPRTTERLGDSQVIPPYLHG